MTQGRSIRLFLVDGTANGLLTAEIMNWTGHVLTGPRSKLTELVQRPECARTGIYFLVGPDPEDNLRTLVYIGESDDVAQRLKQHNRPELQGGKDFWERVCLITSKDQNLTKAHVKYLESALIKVASDLKRCVMVNGTAHDYGNLPESDKADMAFFMDQIRIVLPVLGFDFLRESPRPSSPSLEQQITNSPSSIDSPRFTIESGKLGVKAHGQQIDGLFVVMKGSKTRGEWIKTNTGSYQVLFDRLVASKVLIPDNDGHLIFTEDYAFDSPSAAAAMIYGRSANGRSSWRIESTGQSYADWQDQQLDNLTLKPETD